MTVTRKTKEPFCAELMLTHGKQEFITMPRRPRWNLIAATVTVVSVVLMSLAI